ncbi:hypothetical protein D9M73_82570 [compost metagenome]
MFIETRRHSGSAILRGNLNHTFRFFSILQCDIERADYLATSIYGFEYIHAVGVRWIDGRMFDAELGPLKYDLSRILGSFLCLVFPTSRVI